MLRHLAVLVVLFSISATPSVAGTPSGAGPTASEILDNMVAAYAALASYKDSGEVKLTREGEGERVRRLVFSTSFVRPELFRFEYDKHHETSDPESSERYVVWSDEQGIRSWWAVRPEVREFDAIEHALGGPTGVSHGSATRIPALLMPQMLWGSGMRHLERPVLVGEERIGTSDCYRLEVTRGDRSRRRMTLWLEKETYLVRKVYDSMQLPSGTTHMTATYSPRANIEILPQEFHFVPPL